MYSIIHFHLQASYIAKLSEYQKHSISQPLEIVLPSSGISSRETRVVFYGKFHVGLRVTPSSRSRSFVRPLLLGLSRLLHSPSPSARNSPTLSWGSAHFARQISTYFNFVPQEIKHCFKYSTSMRLNGESWRGQREPGRGITQPVELAV